MTRPPTTHSPLTLHQTRLAAATHLLARLATQLATAWTCLHDYQPGYPGTGNGPTTKSGHSDRTGTLATRNLSGTPDQTRVDLDNLNHLLTRITRDILDATDIVTRYSPPTQTLRRVLATDAAADLNRRSTDTWCTSCIRVGSMAPQRKEGGTLCRWCSDLSRALGGATPPKNLVERHAQGRRITEQDITKAKQDIAKAKRETKKRKKARR